jgi:hypothetical protein
MRAYGPLVLVVAFAPGCAVFSRFSKPTTGRSFRGAGTQTRPIATEYDSRDAPATAPALILKKGMTSLSLPATTEDGVPRAR